MEHKRVNKYRVLEKWKLSIDAEFFFGVCLTCANLSLNVIFILEYYAAKTYFYNILGTIVFHRTLCSTETVPMTHNSFAPLKMDKLFRMQTNIDSHK